jgi:uncharacterized protein (DUF4415 family)
MKKEYEFSRGARGSTISARGTTRITIFLDNATLKRLRAESERVGRGYQALINEVLAEKYRATWSPR